MKPAVRALPSLLAMSFLATSGMAQEAAQAGSLHLHTIFDSDMVFQHGKPHSNP